MAEFVTKDSGNRREFESGSTRDRQEGKGRYDLIPTYPLKRLADLYDRGAKKYNENNWRLGQPLRKSYIDSAFRHLMQLIGGEPTEDHATAVVWNMFAYIWTLNEIEAGRLPKALDDRLPPEPQFVKKEEHKLIIPEPINKPVTVDTNTLITSTPHKYEAPNNQRFSKKDELSPQMSPQDSSGKIAPEVFFYRP